MIGCILGYIASFAFLLCCLYSLFKRNKIFKNIIFKKISGKNILNFHCILGITAVLFSIIHASMEHGGISSTFGSICFALMIIAGASGFLMKYFNKIYSLIFKKIFTKTKKIPPEVLSKIRILLLYIHIGTIILFVFALILHLLIFYLMWHTPATYATLRGGCFLWCTN